MTEKMVGPIKISIGVRAAFSGITLPSLGVLARLQDSDLREARIATKYLAKAQIDRRSTQPKWMLFDSRWSSCSNAIWYRAHTEREARERPHQYH